ncbi:putative RND superfamily exporter protein [Halohasta litchfieldiae]|jgi:predicted RND superfamily exporter protein|uniref:Predicted exporter protein, RND superfamily n=1 Tax=Halohasta litchfieldiae TaxID=1073996 RepID=A0A1H6SQ31_9EURY|nr:MMPL family transporter [Halohasta litchfieldiae]ATW86904.1 putative RND superfamily exporter protein [Halohasta litchfieldiae]SEI70048.1 Predicted exporter protein, RND superfamily [Halohasta litchfieldiae]
MEYQWLIDRVDDLIVNHSKTVVVVFLLVTVVFVGGLGSISSESGQQQFIEDLPSFQAIEDINENFGDSFSEETTSTTLIQESTNVLSRGALIDMLETRNRIVETGSLRVSDTSTTAETIATTLDANATTPDEQLRAVERATPSEIDAAVREADETNPGFSSQLSDDFNRQSASATATQGSVSHRAGPGEGAATGPGGASEFPPNKEDRIERLVQDDSSSIWVQGTPPNTTGITTSVVLPSALVLIMLFLTVAYRDVVDVLIGLFAIVLMLVWTFGFIGLVGIPFAVLLIAVPPILIAIGIDFGIHSINRYREERVKGTGISESMTITTDQVTVAFFIVVGTSAIGFLSNVASSFPPTRDFGITAAAGIVFTFLIFGIFVPALKVTVDRAREKYPIPTFSEAPLGSDDSVLGRLLSVGVTVSKRGPLVFLLLVLVITAGSGVYATGVDTGFSPDDFNPDAETPEYLQYLPESIRPPAEFEYVRLNDYLDENFEQDGQVQMYIEGNMERDTALEELHRGAADPPSTFRSDRRQADSQSIVTLIESRAERDPEFRALVDRNDRDDNGIPDSNLPRIYDELGENADGFLTEGRGSTRVLYTVDGDAEDEVVTQDAYSLSGEFRDSAQPTGSVIIFDEAISLVFQSVIVSLVLTLIGAALFLVAAYWVIEGSPSLGIVNMIPIVVTVVALVASMRVVGLKFNAINGTILAIAVGIGIDYSVHVVHRFADEYHNTELYPALRKTVVGTGGALTGSMLTTVFGIGVLVLALNPALGAFGALISLSVLYAYLASLVVLPSVIVVWARLRGDTDADIPIIGTIETAIRNRGSTVPSRGNE